jgi:phage shock protein PspC (stress-responsive transcriptional regulator)
MNNKIYLSHKYKQIGGVCAGIALYKNWPISLVRLATVALFFLTGIVIVIYLAAWILMPTSKDLPEYEDRGNSIEPFYREKEGAIFAGICIALSKRFGWDSSLVRIICIIIALMGGGLFMTYLVAWLILPRREIPHTPNIIL